jgi:hypothetical protein
MELEAGQILKLTWRVRGLVKNFLENIFKKSKEINLRN